MFSLLTKNWILSVTSYNYVLYRNSSSKTLTRPRSGWMELSGYNYWIHKCVEIHIFQPWTSSGLCQLSAFQSWWILTVLFCFSFVSVYMCVACFMYGCVSGCSTCLWVCENVHMNQDRTSGFLLLPLLLHCFWRGSVCLGWCSVNSWYLPSLLIGTGIAGNPCLTFYGSTGDSNSGPYAWRARKNKCS